jgi:acetoin utilization protein AcuB
MQTPKRNLVADRMTPKPVTVKPSESLAAAQKKMHQGHFRALPVVRAGKLIGIITDRDTRPFLGHLADIPVKEAMTKAVVTVDPETHLEDAAQLLLRHKIGSLPVVENEALVGIITTTDILVAFVGIIGKAP